MVEKAFGQVQESNFIEKLQQELSKPLPAYDAQKLMEPPMRRTFELDSSTARQAATMLLLYFDSSWKFLLITRSSHPLDKHKGQVSFPGGSIEDGESPQQAAIREAYEEINVPQDNMDVLGALSPLFIPVSNFMVYPFVGQVDMNEVTLRRQESEVDEILEISLDEFMQKSSISEMDMKMANDLKLRNVPYYKLGDKIVWGATAMMLSEFREICKRIV